MTAFVGYYDQRSGYAASLENQVGVGFRCIRLNYGFNEDGTTTPKGGGGYLDNEHDRILARWGYKPRGYWNMNLEPGISFADVKARKPDVVACLRSRVQLIKTNPRWTKDSPIFVSFHHEQSVDTHTLYEPGDPNYDNQPSGGKPEDYAGAFKVFHDICAEENTLRSQGGAIMLCFVPTAGQFLPIDKLATWKQAWHVDKIAPDPKLYQYAGCDFYTRPSRPTSADLDYVNAFARKVGKKFIIGELGIQNDVDQGAYINEVRTRLKSYGDKAGGCNAACFTFKADAGNQIEPEAMDEFKALMNDPFFQRTL